MLSESGKFHKIISINDLSMYRDGYMPPKVAEQLQGHLKEQIQNDLHALLVPSQEVHNELLVRFPKMLKRVHIVEPGSDHLLDESSSASRVVDKPYFLFVGTIDKKSNLSAVVKAFQGFCAINKDVQLVITGAYGYGHDAIKKMIDTSPVCNRISLMGYKSGSQLKRLYNDAICLVAPSFYEGFSYPLVEAMKMNCPVITSGVGSMIDIGGEAVHLINPKDPEQVLAGMERFFADRVYRDKKISKGREITRTMSWLNCARRVAEIYNSI